LLGERRSRLVVIMLLLMILLMIPNAIPITASSSSQTLYAHAETTTIGGVSYYLHKVSSADGSGITLSQLAASTGRKLMGRWVYPLSGIVSIPASTWTVTYRAMRSASASSVKAHGDIDILIRKSDNTIRTTIATNVANSPNITLVNAWQTLTGTYNWAAYTVVDQTDYLEVAYYIEVTTQQNSKSVRLSVDNSTLPLADQTKIQNIMFTYPNQAPVASFTFSPSNPAIYETVTFNASASYDPDGNIVSYKWDFGDGNITTVTNPIITHVYTTAGSTVNYTVTLTVTDNEGSTGSNTQSVPVTNPSILHVSLPAGTYVGPDPDNWLSQCWLLSITGLSGTFTIRINNTHASWTSYDTHLIIALNNASYEYLDSLAVDATTIPKTSFIYGTPEPYGFTLTWEEDVYPTWFSDIYVVGTVDPKSYKDVQVSVTFSNTTGVRMHFDAYGSTCSPPPPTGKGRVTHNPHEKDSTVLFCPPIVKLLPHADFTWEPPSPQVCETVTFNASASYDPDGYIINYTWNFGDSNTTTVKNQIITHHYTTFGNYTVTLTVTDNDGLTNSTAKTITVRKHPVANFTWSPFSPQVGELVTFNGSLSTPDGGTIVSYTWNFGDGNITTVPNPIITHVYNKNGTYTVTLNVTDSEGKWDTESEPITVRVRQYLVTFNQTGLDATANSTVVTVNGVPKNFSDLPFQMLVDNGSVITYFYSNVSSTVSGKRFRLVSVTGPTSPITVTGPVTVTGNYKTQYQITFDQTGVGSDFSGTVVIIDGTNYYTRGNLPVSFWWDYNSVHSFAFQSPLVVTSNAKRYVWNSTTGLSSVQSGSITVSTSGSVTGNYKTQYRLTMATNYGTTNPSVGDHWYEAGSTVKINATVISVITGERYVWLGWTGTGTTSYTGMDNPATIIMDSPITETASWTHQYYLTVTSDYDSPTPTSEWFDAGTEITASVTSPWSGTTGIRYICTGWTGTGSVPSSGTTKTVSFTINLPSSITWTWKTQYLLVVDTYPLGLSPQPTRNPPGEPGGSWWYNSSTSVSLTAQNVTGYKFLNWNVDGTNVTGNPITVHMNQPHTATAHYQVYVAPRKCVVDFTETPMSPIYIGTKVTFTVQILQKAFNGTHEINCTLYEWNLTDPNGVSRILRFGKQWNNFSNTMQWTFNINGNWTVTLRAFCDDITLINRGMAWSDPVSHMKKVIPRPVVGGYIAPIDKLSLLVPLIGFAVALIATVASTTLIRHKAKRSGKI